jgi:hypothetical protein
VLQSLPFTFEQKQLNSNTAKFVGDPQVLPRILEKSDFFKKKDNQPRHRAEDLAISDIYQMKQIQVNSIRGH